MDCIEVNDKIKRLCKEVMGYIGVTMEVLGIVVGFLGVILCPL